MQRPLDDITVVSLEHAIAAPLCTRQLERHGRGLGHPQLPPAANSSFDYRMDAIPAIGEHSDAILRELGRSDAEIAAIRAAGAI